MMRTAIALVLAGLAVAVWTQVPPERSETDVGILPDQVLSTTAGCPVVTGRNAESTLAIASTVSATADVIAATSGEVAASTQVELGEFGGGTLGVLDFAGASNLAVVADLPEASSAMTVVTRSPSIVAAGRCPAPSLREVVVSGISTASGESLELVLANPYANDAVVEIRTSSEAGPDSASELESVIVPARSVTNIEMSTLLPLRERIAARVIAERGTVHVAGVQVTTFERMYVEGVPPAPEWYLPIPNTGTPPLIVVAASGPVGADYRIDTFGPSGELEAAAVGSVDADEHAVIDASTLGEGVRAVRVSADGEVVASVVVESDTIRAGTPGATEVSASWLVPGAVGEGAVLRIVNPSGFPAEVVIQSLADGSDVETVAIEPGSTTEIAVSGPGAGYFVRSQTEIVVAWSLASDAGFALAMATPAESAGE